MRITGGTVLEYRRKLDGRSWNPVSRWTCRCAPLLMLHADNGHIGIGEAWSRQDDIERVLDALADRAVPDIVGLAINSPADIDAITSHCRDEFERGTSWWRAAAASAVDIALWDLFARAQDQPVWRLLGGITGHVSVYASGGLYCDGSDNEQLADEFDGYRRDGFRDMKMKVGALPLEQDAGRVRAVRGIMGGMAGMGCSGELWVDAVNQLDASTAVESAATWKAAGATAVQAPVAFDDLATMARIDREALPVIAGEAEWQFDRFASLIEAGAVSFVQANLGLCGGFNNARTIASLAENARARPVRLTLQTHGTAVLQAASLQFGAAASTAGAPVEYHRFHDHLGFALAPALRRVDAGVVDIGETPGIGIAPLAIGEQADGGTIRCHREVGETHKIHHPRT